MAASNIELRFHDEMLEIYHRAKVECHYNANFFIQMVSGTGGLQTDCANSPRRDEAVGRVHGTLEVWPSGFDRRGTCAEVTVERSVHRRRAGDRQKAA